MSQQQNSPLTADKDNDPFKGAPSFPLSHRLLRAVWGVVWALFASWTPPQMRRWRIFLLQAFGAQVDPSAQVYGSARVWYPPNLRLGARATLGPGVTCYCMAPITLGAFVVVSQRAHLCTGTHDITVPTFQIQARPICIGDHAWICAEAFVGPGVTISDGAVLAARAAAFRDLDPWSVWGGNPAVRLKDRPRFDRSTT